MSALWSAYEIQKHIYGCVYEDVSRDNKNHEGFDLMNGLIPSQIHNIMALLGVNERQELGSNWRK